MFLWKGWNCLTLPGLPLDIHLKVHLFNINSQAPFDLNILNSKICKKSNDGDSCRGPFRFRRSYFPILKHIKKDKSYIARQRQTRVAALWSWDWDWDFQYSICETEIENMDNPFSRLRLWKSYFRDWDLRISLELRLRSRLYYITGFCHSDIIVVHIEYMRLRLRLRLSFVNIWDWDWDWES